MEIRICLEEMEGRWIAHAIDLPGCFVTRDEREEALAAAPAAIQEYVAWRRAHGDGAPLPEAPFRLQLEEMFREWQGPERPDYDVSAFFAADAPPLSGAEVATIRQLLTWSRADLLAELQSLSPEQLAQEVEEGWAIQDILVHVGRSEWWYLDRLGLAPAHPGPETPWQRWLPLSRERLLAVLPQLEGLGQVIFVDSEIWSPRKVLRRALWHERDHTAHLRRFKRALGAA